MASNLFNLLWVQSWEVALVFGLVGLACLLLRGASAHLRYLLWLVVLAKCLVPPVMPVALPGMARAMNRVFPDRQAAIQDAKEGVAVGAANRVGSGDPARFVPSGTRLPPPSFWARFDGRRWLVFAWIAGALGYLAAALFKAWRIQLGLKRARTSPDMGLECEFLEIANTVGAAHRPKLCLIHGLGQPFVWGIFRGSIYLPEAFGSQGTPRERALIMSHELAHVVRWDALVNFVQVAAQAVFFFHPLVWWMNKIIRHEREKCCDEAAVASLRVDSQEYGSAIVNRLAAFYEPACPSSSLAISGHARDLEDRVKTLLQPGRAFHRRPAVPVMIAVFLIAAAAAPAHLVVTGERGGTSAADPAHPVTLVDLGAYANASLGGTWLPGASDNDLSELRTGARMLAGALFEIRGVVQLAGNDTTESVRRFPNAVRGVALGRSFNTLHLLHACAGKEEPGTLVAKIVVHYEDGATREIPIHYGERVRDWRLWEFDPVSDPNTTMAWTGGNLNVRSQNGSLRLYRTTWTNPRPHTGVLNLDYVSGRSKPAPFMVGLTVE